MDMQAHILRAETRLRRAEAKRSAIQMRIQRDRSLMKDPAVISELNQAHRSVKAAKRDYQQAMAQPRSV